MIKFHRWSETYQEWLNYELIHVFDYMETGIFENDLTVEEMESGFFGEWYNNQNRKRERGQNELPNDNK